MAEVWSARDTSDRLVALKILRLATATPSMRSMWTDEVKLATRLRHPGIVRVEGAFEDRASLVQVMELVDGKDLRRVLQAAHKRQAVMPLPIAATLVRELAAALAYAHSARSAEGRPLGIVHRDVSPHNVMLTRDGRAKLLDFGIARANERETKTAAGVIKGKLSYMAPEQALGAQLSVRTDIFALGIVFWELLTMRRLFHAESEAARMTMICEARVPAVRSVREDVPESIATLVHRMLALHPKERPDSMRTVEEALSRVLHVELELAEPEQISAWAAPYLKEKKKTAPMPAEPAPEHDTLEVDTEEDEDEDSTSADPVRGGTNELRGALLAPATPPEPTTSLPVSMSASPARGDDERTARVEIARTQTLDAGGIEARYPSTTLPVFANARATESVPTRAPFATPLEAMTSGPSVIPVSSAPDGVAAPMRTVWRWALFALLATLSLVLGAAAIAR